VEKDAARSAVFPHQNQKEVKIIQMDNSLQKEPIFYKFIEEFC
jgi:hypothetical protein